MQLVVSQRLLIESVHSGSEARHSFFSEESSLRKKGNSFILVFKLCRPLIPSPGIADRASISRKSANKRHQALQKLL